MPFVKTNKPFTSFTITNAITARLKKTKKLPNNKNYRHSIGKDMSSGNLMEENQP
jgi:hypothetical protein